MATDEVVDGLPPALRSLFGLPHPARSMSNFVLPSGSSHLLPELFTKLFFSSAHLLYCKDDSGFYVACTKRYAVLTGCRSPEDLAGKRSEDLPWKRSRLARLLDHAEEDCLLSGEISVIAGSVSSRGKHLSFDATVIPLPRGEGVVGLLKRRAPATEKAERALRESETWLRALLEQSPAPVFTVDHDLGIRLCSAAARQLFRTDGPPPSIYELFNVPSEASWPLTLVRRALSGQTVTFRLETVKDPVIVKLAPLREKSGRVLGAVGTIAENDQSALLLSLLGTEEKQVIELPSLVQSQTDALKEQPGIAVSFENLSRREALVYGYPLQLAQLVKSLLDNAVEAARLRVHVSLKSSTGRIELTVADDGEGIPIDLKEKIFAPFFTTKQNHSGLGLSVVSRVLKTHGGRLRVSSSGAGGTVFVAILPSSS